MIIHFAQAADDHPRLFIRFEGYGLVGRGFNPGVS